MASKGKLLYREIAGDLRQAIRQGGLKPGQALPKVRDLAAHYRCSLQTVHRALKIVVEEGLITTRQGAGSHVRDPRRERGTRILAVFEDLYGLKDQSAAAQFLLGATAAATTHSLSIETLAYRSADELAQLIDRVQTENYAGLVWGNVPAPELCGKLDGLGVKQVFVRRSPRLLALPTTKDDLAAGAADVAMALSDRGVRSLACMGPPSTAGDASRMQDRIISEAQRLGVGVPLPEGRCCLTRHLPDSETQILIQHFLTSTQDADAYWFTNPAHLAIARFVDQWSGQDLLAGKAIAVHTTDSQPIDRVDLVLQSDTRTHAREATNLLYHWLRTGKRPSDVAIPMRVVEN